MSYSNPIIKSLPELSCLGMKEEMSFANNQTTKLWATFMPKVAQLRQRSDTNLYSIEVYPKDYFAEFQPNQTFMKWACVRNELVDLKESLSSIVIPSGLYAIFNHKGTAEEGAKLYQYIFTHWITNIEYQLDNRPHLAIMPANYKPNDPTAEEQICIPVRQ